MKKIALFIFCTSVFVGACSPAIETVTETEAKQFATEVEAAAIERKPDFISSRILVPLLVKKIDSIKAVKNYDEIEKGVRIGLKKNEMDKNLLTMLGKKGSFKMVKQYVANGQQHLIFRGFGEGGFNYMDMLLAKYEKKIGIADMFVFVTGENVSKTFAEILEKMTGTGERDDQANMNRLRLVKQKIQEEEYEEAKKQFDFLPSGIKYTAAASVLHFQILANLPGEQYRKEMDLLEKSYAGRTEMQLPLIDVFLAQQRYDKALSAIDQVDAIINKDPFLGYYRGLIYNMSGKPDSAMQYYKTVVQQMPDFAPAYAELCGLSALQGEEQQAKAYFVQYKKLRDRDKDLVKQYEMAYPYLKEASQ